MAIVSNNINSVQMIQSTFQESSLGIRHYYHIRCVDNWIDTSTTRKIAAVVFLPITCIAYLFALLLDFCNKEFYLTHFITHSNSNAPLLSESEKAFLFALKKHSSHLLIALSESKGKGAFSHSQKGLLTACAVSQSGFVHHPEIFTVLPELASQAQKADDFQNSMELLFYNYVKEVVYPILNADKSLVTGTSMFRLREIDGTTVPYFKGLETDFLRLHGDIRLRLLGEDSFKTIYDRSLLNTVIENGLIEQSENDLLKCLMALKSHQKGIDEELFLVIQASLTQHALFPFLSELYSTISSVADQFTVDNTTDISIEEVTNEKILVHFETDYQFYPDKIHAGSQKYKYSLVIYKEDGHWKISSQNLHYGPFTLKSSP